MNASVFMASVLKSKLSVYFLRKALNICFLFVYSDFRKLQRDYPAVDSQKMIDRCRDLGVWCNEVMNTGGRWSMERLVMHIVIVPLYLKSKTKYNWCEFFFF